MERITRWMKTMSVVLALFLSAPLLCHAQPPGGLPPGGAAPGIKPPAAAAPVAPRPGLPEGPQIREFNASAEIVLGELVRLGWQVDPGVTGSRVVHVSILLGETIVEGNVPPTGTREVRLTSFPVGATSVVYTLRATDAAGKISTRNAAVRLMSAQQALRQLEVGLLAEPREFRPGQPIDFKVTIQSGIWPMTRLNIKVSHGGRVVGNLTDYMIRASINIANLRDDGFTGTGGDYTVDIEYREQHLLKQFRTISVPVYTLTPASR